MRRLSSHLLLTPRGLEPGRVVTLADDGTIVDVSHPAHLDREAGVEFFPGILVPGFLNAHCHLELSHLRGAIPSGGGFTAFARGMRSVRGEVAGKDAAAIFWDAKMWSEGVSVVADVCNGSSTFELKRTSRIRYHSFCELFGLRADPACAVALCSRASSLGLGASVTSHSLYSLNRDAFGALAVAASGGVGELAGTAAGCVGEVSLSGSGGIAEPLAPSSMPAVHNSARHSLLPSLSATPQHRPSDNAIKAPPLSIHFMETEQETELFKRRGAMWEWYREQGLEPDFLDYGSPAERLVAQIPRDRPVMLIHNCVVTQRDIDIVMGHFTAPVTWVVCPGSNRYISGLTPPIDLLRKNRLRIAVGTDSLASNTSLSMVRELAMIKNVPLAELLGWAAADAIAPGRAPGLVHLTGVDLQTLRLTETARSKRIF